MPRSSFGLMLVSLLAAAPAVAAPVSSKAPAAQASLSDQVTAPSVMRVMTEGATVHVYFSEPLGGTTSVAVDRADGSQAAYVSGDGSRHFIFSGGQPTSSPKELVVAEGNLLAIGASMPRRELAATVLPTAVPWKTIKIVLAGDSTVASYSAGHASQGWGWALSSLLDSRAVVKNHAAGGRSSKSFRAEGRWDKVIAEQPDIVFIQFGHNDNPGKGPERETDPGEQGDFRENLRRYVREAREAGATPVLVSPPTRRFYTGEGKINPDEGNVPYAKATLAVAKEMECEVVDLNALSRELFNKLGESDSDWIQPTGDRTHFTPTGARLVASLVAGQLAAPGQALHGLVIPEQLAQE